MKAPDHRFQAVPALRDVCPGYVAVQILDAAGTVLHEADLPGEIIAAGEEAARRLGVTFAVFFLRAILGLMAQEQGMGGETL